MSEKIEIKRGDLILDLLYQVYENGSGHGETGFGSFIENVAIRMLELIDDDILTKQCVQMIDKERLIVKHPKSSPSSSFSISSKDK